jgi:signal transduction histidine kinase
MLALFTSGLIEGRNKERGRASQFNLLYRLSQNFSSTLDLKELLGVVTREVALAMDCEKCAALLVDDKGEISFSAAYGFEAENISSIKFKLGNGYVGRIAQNGKTMIVSDASNDSAVSPEIVSREHISSFIHVPIKVKDKVIGVLDVDNKRDGNFCEEDVELLSTLAFQVGTAIDNAHFYELEKQGRVELKRQQKERINFIDTLAHELKTPLASLIASGELLARELGEGEKPIPRLIRSLNRSTKDMDGRISELLDIAKIESERFELRLEELDLESTLEDCVSRVLPQAQVKEQSLELSLPPSLPKVIGDRLRISQIVLNLLSNAVKFAPEGGSIILAAREEEASLTVEVEDNGPGIPEEEIQRKQIFLLLTYKER